MWPFSRSEKRSRAYSDAIIAQAMANASDSTPRAEGLAAVELCAGMWGLALSSATITPSNATTSALSASLRERMGRALLLRGEFVAEIEISNGEVGLLPAASWEITGYEDERSWIYQIEHSGPSGTIRRTLPSARVIHVRIGASSDSPWRGQGPLQRGHVTAGLAAIVESKLAEEFNAPTGQLVPVPATDNAAVLQADLAKAKGRLSLVPTTSDGMGQGSVGSPRTDWVPRRMGAAPPAEIGSLRSDVSQAILAMCGVPTALLGGVGADGGLLREQIRVFLNARIRPLAGVLNSELRQKLLEPQLEWDFEALFLSDISRAGEGLRHHDWRGYAGGLGCQHRRFR